MNGKPKDKKSVLYHILKYTGIFFFLMLLLLPAKYINTVFGYLPFLFVVFILLISVLGMFVLRRSLITESDSDDVECIRGDSVRISLKIRNRSAFVCPKARASIYISDLFGNTDEESVIDFALTAGGVSDFSFEMDMIHIGVYYVGIRNLSVFDMTGLFQINTPVRNRFRVYVNPRIRSLDEMEVSDDVMAESENDTRIASVGGMNYTGVREYEFGDSMKQIHWKLSAHSATYMTKINEINRQNDYAVILDMTAPEYSAEELMDISDCLIETAISILERLSVRDVSYSLLFPDRNREIQRVMPSAGEYSEIIRNLDILTPSPDDAYPDGTQLLENEGALLNRSANVIICSARVTDTLIQKILDIRHQNRTPELFYIFPERLNNREREQLEAPLEELEVTGIDFHMLSTAVNWSFEEEQHPDAQYSTASQDSFSGVRHKGNRTGTGTDRASGLYRGTKKHDYPGKNSRNKTHQRKSTSSQVGSVSREKQKKSSNPSIRTSRNGRRTPVTKSRQSGGKSK